MILSREDCEPKFCSPVPKHCKFKIVIKKIFFCLFFINLTFLAFPNDTFFYLAGGNIVPAGINETNVEMIDEVINIELLNDYYLVTVIFTFYNNGEDENLLVGFPYLLQKQGGIYSTGIYDFKTWVNDQIINFSNDKIEFSEQGYGEIIVDYAFTKNVYFPSKAITKTKVEYKTEYGSASPSYGMATYFYGSGRAWYNNIGKMTINIKNNILNSDKWIYDIQMPEITYGPELNIPVENYINWDNGYMQIQLYGIEPGENDTFAIWFSDPLWDIGPWVFAPERFAYRKELLDDKSLRLLSSAQLRVLRNAFYAFYGYNFRDENLKLFFSKLSPSWYGVNGNFNEKLLTEIERNNVNKILKEEANR